MKSDLISLLFVLNLSVQGALGNQYSGEISFGPFIIESHEEQQPSLLASMFRIPTKIYSFHLRHNRRKSKNFNEFCLEKLLKLKETYRIPPIMSTGLQLFLGQPFYDLDKESLGE